MSYKMRAVRQLMERIFPSLEGLRDELKPIMKIETPEPERISKAAQLLSSNTADLNEAIRGRAQRKKTNRGKIIATQPGGWNIYENDVIILYNYIKFWDYVSCRLISMGNLRFAKLYNDLNDRQVKADEERYKEIDASRFFAFPPATMTAAKWQYWLKMTSLTEEEAVALSLCKDPDKVFLDSISSSLVNDNRRSPFSEEYQLRLRALQRTLASGALRLPLDPAAFVKWTDDNCFYIPDQLAQAFYGPGKSRRSSQFLVDELAPKYRRSLRLILLLMAIDKYGHKLDGNSTAITQIVDAFIRKGIPLHRDTVKDALTDAAEDEDLENEVAILRKCQRGS